jgi:hypothetical protein
MPKCTHNYCTQKIFYVVPGVSFYGGASKRAAVSPIAEKNSQKKKNDVAMRGTL